MSILISCAQAKQIGLNRYFTGKPCPNGHVSERFVRSWQCVQCKYVRDKKRAARNPENRKRYRAAHAAKYPEKVKAWERENKERVSLYSREYRKRNPGKVREIAANRRARKLAAEGSHTADEIRALYQRQGGKCANCHTSLAPGYHADHIIPLVRGGSNWISNIQLLCPPCNISKGAKLPHEWARENGRLL